MNKALVVHGYKQAVRLDSRAKRLLHAMWHGVDQELTLGNGEKIAPGTPIGDYVAAKALGMSRRHLEYWRHQRVFKDALHEQRLARFEAEDPTNFATAQSIRDNPLQPGATRLAAIDRLRIKDPAPAVHVDLSRHDNRQQTLMAPAGYVVNLGTPVIEEKE